MTRKIERRVQIQSGLFSRTYLVSAAQETKVAALAKKKSQKMMMKAHETTAGWNRSLKRRPSFNRSTTLIRKGGVVIIA